MGTVDHGIEQVSPEEAEKLVADGALLLDVREAGEWSAGHAPDAVHVPLGQLPDRHADVLDAGRRIVAVCRVGGRSQHAAMALQQAGYDAVNLAGGMHAWAGSGRPVVTDDGGPGTVA